MFTVNPELLALAQHKFEKVAVVPPGGGMDPAMAAGGGMPVDPAALGAVPPATPADASAAMAAMAPPAGDPAAAAGAAVPAPLPPADPAMAAGGAVPPKMKPEQMMQMLDYRLYNVQQQLTAIMNAMGVQVAPEALVMPPGMSGAPAPESALPGGPAEPPTSTPADAGMPPEAVPPDMAGAMPPKAANWWDPEPATPVSRVGGPISKKIANHTKAAAAKILQRSLKQYED